MEGIDCDAGDAREKVILLKKVILRESEKVILRELERVRES